MLRRYWAIAVAAGFLASAGVLADEAPQAAYKLSIGSQPMDSALNEFARQSGLQVVLQTNEVRGITAPRVEGTFTARDALLRLLENSGLEFEYLNERTVAVRARGAAEGGATASGIGGGGTGIAVRLAQSDSSATAPGTDGTSSDQREVNSESSAEDSQNKAGKLEEIVVTAQKRSERLQDVPISISVLGGNDLDKSTFSGVTEALNTVPGVSAFANQFQQGGTLLSFRGVGPAALGTGASTVAYYIDSVPFGLIRSAFVPDPNVYDLRQIEVLRGPQGTLYGANALNGVVRVLTNDPDLNNFDFKARGVLSTTETGGANYSGDLAVNVPIVDGKLAARVVVGDDHESGWINSPLGVHINEGDLSNVRLKIDAQPLDALTIGLSAWHSQSRYDAPSESDSNRNNPVAIYPQPFDTQFNAYGFKINYDFPMFLVSSMMSYVVYTNTNILDLDYVVPNVTASTNFTSRVFSEEVNLTSKLASPWRWSVGAMYRDDKDRNWQDEFVFPGPMTSLLDDYDDTSRSEAVYGELGRHFFHDELEWTLGLRYFHDDESTYANQLIPAMNIVSLTPNNATSSATTPRAVITWRPNQDMTVYASYSQGFRSGVPQEELVGSAIPNFPPLKPDKLTNYEVGAKGALWDGFLSYDAAVYYIKWKDIQQEINVLQPGIGYVYVQVNGDSASGHGADLSLKTQPRGGFTFGAEFSWNSLHLDSTVYSGGVVLFPQGSRPDYSPEYTAGLSAQYSFPLGKSGLKGAFSASGNYISPLDTTILNVGTVAANSLLLTRGSMAIEFPAHWAVALFVDNANNYYGSQTAGSGAFPELNPRQRPRTYGVRFDYHLR